MDEILKKQVKKGLLIASIFIFLILIYTSFLFLDFFKFETLKTTTQKTITSSRLVSEYKNITNITQKKSPNILVFPVVFEASSDGKNIDIYLVRLTGKYGTYIGLFLYDGSKQDAMFSGLLVDDVLQKAENYGINDGIINYWKSKIKHNY